MARILVTPRSLTQQGHPALNALSEVGYDLVFSCPGQQPTEEELVRLLPGCVGYLAGVEKVTARVLESSDELKVISRNGTGVDNIDLEAAERLGIRVCRAVGANSRGVAELTIALILALVRAVPFSDARLKRGGWERRRGIELAGRSLGLIGCGKVGKLVTEFALVFGMDVVAYDIAPDPSFQPSDRFRFASLDIVLEQSDIVSLHCPSCPDGAPLVDAGALARMRQGVFIVNTARPDLIDEKAMIAFLDRGHVAGLALDVFEREPPGDDPLVMHDRVVATPHIGGFTRESIDRAAYAAVENLLEHLKQR